MEREAIFDRLTAIFQKVFKNQALILVDELTANDVDNWDSLTHMILITEIESAFSITFKLRELNKMRNVGDMIAMIKSKM